MFGRVISTSLLLGLVGAAAAADYDGNNFSLAAEEPDLEAKETATVTIQYVVPADSPGLGRELLIDAESGFVFAKSEKGWSFVRKLSGAPKSSFRNEQQRKEAQLSD